MLMQDQRQDQEKEAATFVRRAICGLVTILITDMLLCPAGIVITFWYPGISFASAIYSLFTGVIVVLISEKSLKVNLLSRLKLVLSAASFFTSAFQAIWSILLAVGNETLDIMEWLTVAAGAVYLVHLIALITDVAYIIGKLRATRDVAPPRGADRPPNYRDARRQTGTSNPSASTRKPPASTSSSTRGGLPQYDDLV